MKIRNGFVSNSSSSSFIVFVKKNDNTINSEEDYKKAWFKNYVDDEEEYQAFIKNDIVKWREYWDNGFGLFESWIDYGCTEEIEGIFDMLGGKGFKWID